MGIVLRIGLPLLALLGCMAYGVSQLVSSTAERWFRHDAGMRSELVYRSVADRVVELDQGHDADGMRRLFDSIATDDRVLAIGLCAPDGRMLYASAKMPESFRCDSSRAAGSGVISLDGRKLIVAGFPILAQGRELGRFTVLHDLSFLERRSAQAQFWLIVMLVGLGLTLAASAVALARFALRDWVRSVRAGLRGPMPTGTFSGQEVAPVVHELRQLLRERDVRPRASSEIRITWSPDTLRQVLQDELTGAQVIVVSNREPYIHNLVDGEIDLQVPASGLVAALEPVTRATSGTWVAHGSGSADHLTVDRRGRLRVPPANPAYTLRRVWLSEDEQQGYYYGFANEGLWPLCHIVFMRPIFRITDWETYKAVNRKFADVVVAEARTSRPVVLVQDYHFALLPRMIRDRLPDATIITFWHIPWPNSETFSICPWREEILDGLLGSSILGFHTQFHCNNFFESVDRFLEARIERDESTISFRGELTQVQAYPISIEWPPSALAGLPSVAECRQQVFERHGIARDVKLAVGVERFDYTKGIIDRFRAVAEMFEHHPEWVGRFSFLQIAAPSRGKLASYQQLQQEVIGYAAELNERFGRDGYQPIVLVNEHHDPADVFRLFRAADVCVVSSLHDGMNLVAKEFVAAREDEQGVLVLSTFAGASRELLEALIVNPYDNSGMGEILHRALTMPPEEQRERMRYMREIVRDNNVYRWAGSMLLDAARLRKRNRIADRIARGGISARVIRGAA